LAYEIVDFAVFVEYQEIGGRFISRSLFAPSGLGSFGIRSRSPRRKHHDTDSDFLEESKSLIFSHAFGGRADRRVRGWHDQDGDKILSPSMPLIPN
jgi:hypothetical protein